MSGTSRAGAELGYDVSVVGDAIGDRDIPGASAEQLVEVRYAICFFVILSFVGGVGSLLLMCWSVDCAG